MSDPIADRLAGFGTTIFAEITALALEHKAINLGQGFPDFEGPAAVKEAAIEAIRGGANQYCRSFGIPAFNGAVARHRQRFYDLRYDADTEVTTYCGATEAICATLLALCNPGDDVVVFEPFYDSYRGCISMAGANVVPVTLHDPDFRYAPETLEAAITPRTRAILLNTPHNPTGKVFSRAELEHIAELCRRHDLIAITDEVYEHLAFDAEHVPLATLPGMQERTVMISSTGKTFSFTGWKVGFSCAPPPLTRALRTAHQFITFCNSTPFQHALATALDLGDDYYREFLIDYRARRDRLCDGLRAAGFDVRTPAGTYFACADIRPLGTSDGDALCRALPAAAGVAAIPNAAFYLDRSAGEHLVRFAFCKSDALIDEGVARLQRWAEART